MGREISRDRPNILGTQASGEGMRAVLLRNKTLMMSKWEIDQLKLHGRRSSGLPNASPRKCFNNDFMLAICFSRFLVG
jgi:hypothetical protein